MTKKHMDIRDLEKYILYIKKEGNIHFSDCQLQCVYENFFLIYYLRLLDNEEINSNNKKKISAINFSNLWVGIQAKDNEKKNFINQKYV